FILRITERIWEERHVEDIRQYYTADCRVETPAGITSNVEAVIQSTLETLNQFPDRQLLGEDVIWSEDQTDYFYSSHRIFSTMTHLGEGTFGKGTGARIGVRTIADCAVFKNQIYDEWLVRDHAAILSDIGLPLQKQVRNPFTVKVMKIDPKLTEFTYLIKMQLSIMSKAIEICLMNPLLAG
ncbi:MAG: hypothetical protein VW876_08060, partial [Deltaproteobacteria bacterium]